MTDIASLILVHILYGQEEPLLLLHCNAGVTGFFRGIAGGGLFLLKTDVEDSLESRLFRERLQILVRDPTTGKRSS